ncbi:RNA methyltransferase [Methanocella sp. CWC-04]|uniref:RNA methyltransferase n=2 Tax=Methanooceanicella nereidis TaxID=2052831 RepID=A0AAP2RBY0_9EURY|nr:RNA methyltransferase [Methanocella sp. CWC-04]
MAGKGLKFRVILVEPFYEGNVGSVCRAMKNFGFDDLVLVKPCEMKDFAKAMASHAQDLLARARIVDTFEEAIEGADYLVATTGKPGARTSRHIRMPYFNPKELRQMLEDKSGTVALIFGREDVGLVNEYVERCDMVVYIPTSVEYPIMNLSHAATVILYELSGFEGGNIALADGKSLERLYSEFRELLVKINHPEHKRDKTLMMLRRVLGRAMLNNREFYTMIGIIRDVELKIERMEKEEVTEEESS